MNISAFPSRLRASLEKRFGRDEARVMVQILAEDLPGRISEKELVRRVERLLSDEPIQYVTGKVYFFGLRFFIDKRALIPRPETEELLALALEEAPMRLERALDICSGSGCIAIAMKHSRPGWRVHGIESEPGALKLAMKNMQLYEKTVEFTRCNILKDKPPYPRDYMDLILCNPPYVPRTEEKEMDARVKDHEPHSALFVPGDDPLLFYRVVLRDYTPVLKKGGRMWFECHHRKTGEVALLMKEAGFGNVKVIRDISGKQRFVFGQHS